nr:MAG TPA: hypothetical protein [Caudoviricetes sp.]
MNYEINDLFLSIFEIKSRNKKSPLSREGCTCTTGIVVISYGNARFFTRLAVSDKS